MWFIARSNCKSKVRAFGGIKKNPWKGQPVTPAITACIVTNAHNDLLVEGNARQGAELQLHAAQAAWIENASKKVLKLAFRNTGQI